ncbi:MAG: hypothetical protein LBK61_11580 [Spirochaetaceae bacterium]|nr:hypothetical protein [Spirochaetaceae bacterium]
MKRFFVLSVAVLVALSMAGCGSTPVSSGPLGSGLSGVPSFVNDAYLNASEDVLIGIGTYKIGNDMSKMGTGKTFAETRARADLARQLDSIVKNMVNDYSATSEIDSSAAVSFQETVTQALSKAQLRGARTVKMDRDDNGLLWVVMEFSKSAAAEEVNQAANAAKLSVPQAAAFDALGRMEAAFGKEAGGGPVPVGD